jgi:hypothetical protein
MGILRMILLAFRERRVGVSRDGPGLRPEILPGIGARSWAGVLDYETVVATGVLVAIRVAIRAISPRLTIAPAFLAFTRTVTVGSAATAAVAA